MSNFRPEIQRMFGYVPGEQTPAEKVIKLNTNENPYTCSAQVVLAIESVLENGLARYPDPTALAFRQHAAGLLGVEPDWIMTGNGSDDILTIVTRAYAGQGDRVRIPYPSYVLYHTIAQIQGASSEEVCFTDDWKLPPEFSEHADRLKLAYLPNPNSPSGTMIPPDQILEISQQLPCPLLVDEAYVDFAETNCLGLLPKTDKILICRSFSKSYSLAGLRFGYVVAQPHVIENLRKVKDSYNCDSLSIAGAIAAIDDQDWLQETSGKIIATRSILTAGMRELGFNSVDSKANFVWNPHPDVSVRRLYQELKKQNVLVRYMDYPDWGDGLRITVGTDEQVELCLDLLEKLM